MKKNMIYCSIIIVFTIILSTIGYYTYQILTNTTQEDLSNNALFTYETMPRVDASLATQPLMDAFYANFMGVDSNEVALDYTNTHPSYLKLIDGETDLIIVTWPSAEELAYADEKKVTLEIVAVVNEGFVFFVNSSNKVDNLTLNEIRDIYSGKITSWQELGGEDEKIKAYQRPVNSGSQTGMLSLVMKNTKMKEPEIDEYVETMSGIIEIVANYQNNNQGIGYSYYYYASEMYGTEDIQFLGVDGIKPSFATIQDESYPLMSAYYIVTRKNESNEYVTKLKDAMLSTRGKVVAKGAGYVPIK